MKKNEKQTILIIDGYHLLHKGYYGSLKRSKVATNRDGQKINAIFTFASKMNQLIDSGIYRTILVAFDTNDGCWRHKAYPQYKKNRKETPADLIPQMTIVREMLTAMNVPWYQKDGYEGDDIIGTIACIAEKVGYNVHIMTDDKDLYQLVDKNVKIVTKSSKRQKGEYIDNLVVKEKFQCEPEQVADMKSLMGDSSDNIKGVRFLHYQTATKLLAKYGSTEGIIENLSNIPKGTAEKLECCKDQILLNKKITTISRTVKMGRIDFRPLRINWNGYLRFLKKERMWAFVGYVEAKRDALKEQKAKKTINKNKTQANKKLIHKDSIEKSVPNSCTCAADVAAFNKSDYILDK